MNKLTVSASETAVRLNNLTAYLPDADGTLCSFARFLATRLNSKVSPSGFMVDCLLAVNHWPEDDSNKVKDCVAANLQKVVDAIFPADFAKAVKESNEQCESFMEEMRQRRRGNPRN